MGKNLGEYREGTISWQMHSSESAHRALERELKKAQERERALAKKGEEESKARAKFNEEQRLADERSKVELADLRVAQEEARVVADAQERRRLALVTSPEGKAQAEAARRSIEFFGNEPSRQVIVSEEGQPKANRKGILGLGILDI
ncbi:hypothetical protein ES703_00804 [subsurface metagenome]